MPVIGTTVSLITEACCSAMVRVTESDISESRVMADRRFIKRYPMKIAVRFGFGSPTEKGITENISAAGMFVKTATIYMPRTIVRVEFVLPGNIAVRIEGRVTWRREFSSRFVRILKMNGVGIKFIRFYAGEQVYKRLIRELQGENV